MKPKGIVMDSKLNEATDGFVENIGQLGASLGLNRVAAQLYALLFMSRYGRKAGGEQR